MWYRTSATRVDPTGQINIDYPNIKPYFDIDNNVKIVIDDSKAKRFIYDIYAKLTNGKNLGKLSLYVDPESNDAEVTMVEIYDYPAVESDFDLPENISDKPAEDVKQELQNAGYQTDDNTYTRTKWGIGKKLYQAADDFVKKFPNVLYITGNVHSKEALNARNSVFGLPHKITPTEESENVLTNDSSIEETKKYLENIYDELESSHFSISGNAVIPMGSSYEVTHKLKRPKMDNKEEQPRLFNIAIKKIWTKTSNNQESNEEWLERHKVDREGDKYVFYHGSRLDLTELRAGSLLATSPQEAEDFGNTNFWNDKRKTFKVYKVLVNPDEIHPGYWASLMNNHPVEILYKKRRL